MASTTTFIMKSLLVADLKATHGEKNVESLDDNAINKMTIEDHVMQDARVKMGSIQDRNDEVMNKFGETGALISKISEKQEDAFSGDFADDYNAAIERTNHRSQEAWQLEQNLEKKIESGIASRDELIQATTKGGMSSGELLQKLDSKVHDAKDSTNNLLDQGNTTVTQQEKELPLQSRLDGEAKHTGYKTRVLRAHALGDNDLSSDTSNQGPAQESSGGGSSIAPS